MAEIFNLRQQRKTKGRSEKEKKAAANRALHGQTKAQKQKKKMEEDCSYDEKIREGKRKARLFSQAAYNKKNEERVRRVRQMRTQKYKYSEISKETGFFISVIDLL